MSEQVTIQKTIYSLNSFNNVVDTNFSQLAKTSSPVTNITTLDKTVSQFFQEYDSLFFDIPPSGSNESHLGLATRSLEYLGLSLDSLQNEINDLREENVNLKNQILLTSQINIGTQI
jgi:flagellar biosynthesis/type III secretory pathway chaperone